MAGKSYIHSPGTTPIIYSSIPDLLDENAQRYPDKGYVFWSRSDENSNELKRQTTRLSDLASNTKRFAASLLNIGLKPGDHVAIYGRPSPQWLLIDLALLRIKVLLLRLPQSLMFSDDLPSFLKKYRCKVLFIDAEIESNIFKHIETTLPDVLPRSVPGVTIDNSETFPQFVISARQTKLCPGVLCLEDIPERDDFITKVIEIQSTIDPDEPAVVFPTSGSTGIPKMVLHSNISIVYGLSSQNPDSVIFNDRLFSWLGSALYLSAVAGCTYLHVETKAVTDVSHLFRIIGSEKAMLVGLPLFAVKDTLTALDNNILNKPPTLVGITSSGEPVPQLVRVDILRHFQLHLIVYASTECGIVCLDMGTSHTIGDPSNDKVTLSVAPSVEVKVIGQNGLPVPLGETGMLCSRSSHGFVGYLGDPEKTKEIKSESGWVKSGDIAIMTPEKKIQLLGRAADIISKGGVKIYPYTIEKILKKHKDVDYALVMGVPDARYNEEIGACVRLKPGCLTNADALREFCKSNIDTSLGISLVPEYILIVDEIPKLPNGKINRLQIKEDLLESSRN